jgi:hypothetical protein
MSFLIDRRQIRAFYLKAGCVIIDLSNAAIPIRIRTALIGATIDQFIKNTIDT